MCLGEAPEPADPAEGESCSFEAVPRLLDEKGEQAQCPGLPVPAEQAILVERGC